MLESILGVEGGVRYTEEDYRDMHKETDIKYTYNRSDNTITVNGPFTFWSNGYMYHFVGDETFEINSGVLPTDHCYYALVVRKEPSTNLPSAGSAHIELVKKQDYNEGVIDVDCLYEDQILQIRFYTQSNNTQVDIYDVRDKSKPRRYLSYPLELISPSTFAITDTEFMQMLNKFGPGESLDMPNFDTYGFSEFYNSGLNRMIITRRDSENYVSTDTAGSKIFDMDILSKIYVAQSKSFTEIRKKGTITLSSTGYTIQVDSTIFTVPYSNDLAKTDWSKNPYNIGKASIYATFEFNTCPVSTYIRLKKPLVLHNSPKPTEPTLWCKTSFTATETSGTWSDLNTDGYMRPAFQNSTSGLRLIFHGDFFPNDTSYGFHGDYSVYAIPYINNGGSLGINPADTAGVMHKGYLKAHHQSHGTSFPGYFGMRGIPLFQVTGTENAPGYYSGDYMFRGTVTFTTLPVFHTYEVV